MRKNQAIYETQIYILTSSMITVRCASVNRVRAVVHELTQKPVYRHVPYEARVQFESENFPGFLFDLLNGARGPAADGPDRRTCSTNLIHERMCSRTKEKA